MRKLSLATPDLVPLLARMAATLNVCEEPGKTLIQRGLRKNNELASQGEGFRVSGSDLAEKQANRLRAMTPLAAAVLRVYLDPWLDDDVKFCLTESVVNDRALIRYYFVDAPLTDREREIVFDRIVNHYGWVAFEREWNSGILQPHPIENLKWLLGEVAPETIEQVKYLDIYSEELANAVAGP